MNMGIVILLIVLFIVLLIVGWFIGTYNGIKVSDLKVSEALSGIDVALTKRFDVLTKMLDTVKGYMNYEKETLAQIVKLRAGMSMNERNAASSEMDRVSGEIKILAEQYPELRSSINFVELQRSITDVEEHLQAARRLYNANVTDYNKKIVTFPSSIVAGMIGATSKSFFEAESQKRNDVNMQF